MKLEPFELKSDDDPRKKADSQQRLALRTTDKRGASPRSLQRLAEWEDWTDAELDALKAGFKAAGCPEVSVYLLTHKDSLRAQCPPCGVWFAVEEIERAKGCPKCGQANDFEVPDEYAALVGEGEKPCEQSRAGSQSDQDQAPHGSGASEAGGPSR
jgi:ribosomal protein S27AE